LQGDDHDGAVLLRIDETQFDQNPHGLYDVLRVESPVREIIAPGGVKVWLVTGYEEAKVALADSRLSKRIDLGQKVIEQNTDGEGAGMVFAAELAAHMMNTDPPDHTRLRKQVNKVFTTRAVEKLRPRVEKITKDLLDAIADEDRVDLMSRFAQPLPMMVICELLGVPTAERDRFRGWVPTQLSGGPETIAETAPELLGYLQELVDRKRSEPADDLLTGLVTSSDEGKLTTQELVSTAFLLLVAGHETTIHLLGNGIFAMLTHPGQLAALRADRSLLPNAIEEFLRYESPTATSSLRFTTEPVEMGGVVVPAGELVVVALGSANRDETQFPDGDCLDVRRKAGGHLAFGHGVHYCVGAPLARLEAQIAFGQLLDRFPALRLPVDPGTLRWRPGTVVRGLETLPVLLHG
jgi:cytochrome P450